MSKNRNRNRPRNNQPARSPVQQAQAASQGFSFTWDGRSYRLPPASECRARVPAGEMIDAVMDGSDQAQARFGLVLLHAAELDDHTMNVLRQMPLNRFLTVLGNWLTNTGGVGPGESERSSN